MRFLADENVSRHGQANPKDLDTRLNAPRTAAVLSDRSRTEATLVSLLSRVAGASIGAADSVIMMARSLSTIAIVEAQSGRWFVVLQGIVRELRCHGDKIEKICGSAEKFLLLQCRSFLDNQSICRVEISGKCPVRNMRKTFGNWLAQRQKWQKLMEARDRMKSAASEGDVSSNGLHETRNFDSNPGALRMFSYPALAPRMG